MHDKNPFANITKRSIINVIPRKQEIY